MRRLIAIVALYASLAGCRALLGIDDPHVDGDAGNDGEPDAIVIGDAYVPDAGACLTMTVECAGPVLRTCTQIGQQPVDTPCGWGCSTAPTPHCAKLQPSGGALTPADLDDPTGTLADAAITVDTTTTWNTDTGAIGNVRAAGTGVKNGIDFQVRGAVGIFRMKSLRITPGQLANIVAVRGSHALAIVSIGPVIFDRTALDLSGGCNNNMPGPGGFAGGPASSNGSGNGGGGAGHCAGNACTGGSGAGHGGIGGTAGGNGGAGPVGGAASGAPAIPILVGGGGGGGGGSGGVGGGGGGAVQIASNASVRLKGDAVLLAGILAGGCGGRPGGVQTGGGGGGGAGGAILIEAPVFEIDAGGLSVNGGGGGGGGGAGTLGANGAFTTLRSLGGASTKGIGGAGGARAAIAGGRGEDDADAAGGGGGAVGRIRFSTFSGFITVNNGFLSPSLADDGAVATQATAVVQ